jgi:5-dehydro-2-deoxygluconokinase
MHGLPRPLSLITMGRAIVDIYGEQVGCRLEDVSTFAKYVGGCPANIAIGVARLGLRTGMITRVGNDHHGRYLKEQLDREGVDTQCVVSDDHRLTGVAFLAIRDQETFPLLHYRDDCADMAIEPTDYSDYYLASSHALLVSGSHLTTEKSASNVHSAIMRAHALGTKIIFDIDYRPLFWRLVARDAGESRYEGSEEATRKTQAVLRYCDLVVGTEEEIHLAGGDTDTIAALRRLRSLTQAPIVLKRGSKGCVVFPRGIPASIDDGIIGSGFPVEVFNVVGAGDGFLSGFLSGWLQDQPWNECCRRANACGAIVVSRHGCSPASPTNDELKWFLAQDRLRPDLRNDQLFEEIHWATTRRPRPEPLFIVACDHFTPFARLPASQGRTVAGFKTAVANAVLRLKNDFSGLGVIFDSKEGRDALRRVGGDVGWVARKIEFTGEVPLSFTDGLSPSTTLREWPRYQIAKCLVPECSGAQADLQNERLRELQYATRQNGIELLLELIHEDTGGGLDRVLARIAAIQTLGIAPDWWKLPAFSDDTAWSRIETVVLSNNAYCRGVVVLGGGRPLDELARSFTAVASCSFVKGFAVGRTLVEDVAAEWLAARIDEGDLEQRLRERLRLLIDHWPHRRQAAA